MSEPTELSDEALARTLWESALDRNGYVPMQSDRDYFWNGKDHPEIRAHYIALARAARAKLCPPVPPLAPGGDGESPR